MQPRMLLGSTFALAMGLSGLAYAGGQEGHPHGEQSRATTGADAKTMSASREQTLEMQRALIARNLYQGPADGIWGPKTEAALRNFQIQTGLQATGALNDPTAQALGLEQSGETAGTDRQMVSGRDDEPAPGTTSTTTSHSQARLEDGGTNVQLSSLNPEQAREMQQRLQLLGYYRGEIDGKVGEGTRAALQRYFQRQADLARQGVISNSAVSLFGTQPKDVPGQSTP